MAIPEDNLQYTDQAVLNRAKKRVIKKNNDKYSTDVVLQDIDITKGNANEKADQLISVLTSVETNLDLFKLYYATTANRMTFPNKTSLESAITILNTNAPKIKSAKSVLEKLVYSLNYVSSQNILDLNVLLEKIQRITNNLYSDSNKDIHVNAPQLDQERTNVIRKTIGEMDNNINIMNEYLDTAIQNYNDRTTKSNLQRMTPVQATKKGGRSYRIPHNYLEDLYI